MSSATITIKWGCDSGRFIQGGETITGSLSGATATIASSNEDVTILSLNNVSGTFVIDDIVEPPGGMPATITSIS